MILHEAKKLRFQSALKHRLYIKDRHGCIDVTHLLVKSVGKQGFDLIEKLRNTAFSVSYKIASQSLSLNFLFDSNGFHASRNNRASLNKT